MKHKRLTHSLAHCGALMLVLATLLGSAFLTSPARAEAPGVLRATLENGLRVVIVRNTLAAAVTTAVNYLVGGDDSPEGFPGMAHAQEHMMFRGSAGLASDQLTYLASMMGGNFNADTRETATQYFFTVPAENLDIALHIEALRMHDVFDNQKDWDTERGAIEQEVAQDLSSPRYILSTKLREAMFAGTPYAHDALGTRPSFDKTTGGMLKSFYQKWYAPNNAVLVIVGNVDPQATLAMVRQLFGSIPSKKLPPHPDVTLQPVKAQSFALTTDLPYGMDVLAFRLPGLDSPDYAAAEILDDVLSSQRADLYGLVPDGKALFADFAYEPLPKAGLAYAMAGFPSDGNGEALQAELRKVIAKIVHDGVPADLVTAAKLQEVHTAEFEKNSIRGLATVWSEAVAINRIE
jgi:zinc protease